LLLHNLVEPDQNTVVHQLSMINQTVSKLNSGDVRFICLEAQTLVEKKCNFKVFLLRKWAIHHGSQTQIASRAKRRL